MTEQEAKNILTKVMSYSKAEECDLNLGGSVDGNIRYALNTVTTSGTQSDVSLAVQSTYGKKSGVATVNAFDDTSLERAVRRSEELAKLAPENPEYMPVLGSQTFGKSKAFFDSTANITPDYRAQSAAYSIKPCRGKGLTAAGFLNDSAGFQAKMTSKGLFAYHPSTNVEFTVTVRTDDGTGSGWASRDFNDVKKLDTGAASRIAMEKAANSVEAKAIEPGKYTVILEPAATANLVGNMIFNMAARNADEGRSFLSKKGGGTKVGEKIVDERINIYSDPNHPEVPFSPWSGDGRPRKKTYWIKDGVVKNLFYSRYWAEKQGVEGQPAPGGGVIAGGDASLEELIRGTERGILVTRLWYIRSVDPVTLLYTGLTRDGTFFIENGKIKHPIKNMRFNESPVIMLNNVEALGKVERYQGNLIPPLKVRDFTFTSLSDAV